MTTPPFNHLRRGALDALAQAHDQRALDDWRIAWFGRKDGRLTQLLRGLASLPIEERKAAGAAANALKDELEQAYEARAQELRRATLQRSLRSRGWLTVMPTWSLDDIRQPSAGWASRT